MSLVWFESSLHVLKWSHSFNQSAENTFHAETSSKLEEAQSKCDALSEKCTSLETTVSQLQRRLKGLVDLDTFNSTSRGTPRSMKGPKDTARNKTRKKKRGMMSTLLKKAKKAQTLFSSPRTPSSPSTTALSTAGSAVAGLVGAILSLVV